MNTIRKVEIGGGRTPRGEGFFNVDRLDIPGVDLVVATLDGPPGTVRLPFDDDQLDEVYSSHCFEHLDDCRGILREIVRCLRPAGKFELRVPHWAHNMALCHGHRHTIGEEQIEHWTGAHWEYWLGGLKKRLFLTGTQRIPSGRFNEAQRLFPHLTRDQVMRFIPDTCHELRFILCTIEA